MLSGCCRISKHEAQRSVDVQTIDGLAQIRLTDR